VIDVGGESTRPGSLPVAADEQIGASSRSSANGRRFGANGPAISVDTRWPRWRGGRGRGSGGGQRRVRASRRPDLTQTVGPGRRRGHHAHEGTPADMQIDPKYEDVTREVKEYLAERTRAA